MLSIVILNPGDYKETKAITIQQELLFKDSQTRL
ncbi:hypothetical protein HDE70_004523 [Pedobacter cryoconitis]|nr:hypothetical protein [Pedobacter cryoconitis]